MNLMMMKMAMNYSLNDETCMDDLTEYCQIKSYGSRRKSSKLPNKLKDFVAPSRPSSSRSKTSKRK